MASEHRASDFLDGILKSARNIASRSDVVAAIERALGPETASHCRIVGERKGRLTVEVASAPLFAELEGFRKEEIRCAINDSLDTPRITELRFRLNGTAHG